MHKSLLSVLLIVAVLPPGALATHVQSDQRCFETGYCISGPIREYWEQNGGLAIFGYPIGEQQT
ncbi:MAG: class F sortase, partial [Chloroflexales bacterium]|nr:class F sortase [Chloroflexales bacterium]